MVYECGEWEFMYLKDHLPEAILLQLRTVPCLLRELGADCIRWRGSSHNKYSVADMFTHMTQSANVAANTIWKKIWNWRGPRRIQVFLWLANHDRLLTSSRRAKLLGCSPLCCRCGLEDKSLEHAIRECTAARNVWLLLNREEVGNSFFQMNGRDWFRLNGRDLLVATDMEE